MTEKPALAERRLFTLLLPVCEATRQRTQGGQPMFKPNKTVITSILCAPAFAAVAAAQDARFEGIAGKNLEELLDHAAGAQTEAEDHKTITIHVDLRPQGLRD